MGMVMDRARRNNILVSPRRFCGTVLCACVAAAALAPLCGAESLAPGEPPVGCYIGAYIELDAVVKDDISAFETLTGKKHASYFRYVGYGRPFPFEWAHRLRAAGAVPHIAWEPNEGLDKVRDDEYLRGWAQAAAHFGGPIFLRYASEMNGDWETYSGDPDLYIEKWRLVRNVMRRYAPNVIMLWVPFATPKSTIPLYYPGDDYVDWVGVNIYSVVHYEGNINKRSVDNAVQHLEFIYNLYAERKPIAIGEYAATHWCAAIQQETVDFAVREMRRLYESIETRFPRVRMINWFSVDTVGAGLANNNYSVTCNPRFLERYRQFVSDPYFIGRLPDLSGRIASLPATAQWEDAASTGAQAVERQPVSDGPPPPTDHPLALARPGPVAPGQMDIAVTGAPPAQVSGNVEIIASVGDGLDVEIVTFYIDDQWRGMTNVPPYRLPWDASTAPAGVREIRAVGMSAGLHTLIEKTVSVIVPDSGE